MTYYRGTARRVMSCLLENISLALNEIRVKTVFGKSINLRVRIDSVFFDDNIRDVLRLIDEILS